MYLCSEITRLSETDTTQTSSAPFLLERIRLLLYVLLAINALAYREKRYLSCQLIRTPETDTTLIDYLLLFLLNGQLLD
jgi:hypothetical protein